MRESAGMTPSVSVSCSSEDSTAPVFLGDALGLALGGSLTAQNDRNNKHFELD
jgi:hypothetical protein